MAIRKQSFKLAITLPVFLACWMISPVASGASFLLLPVESIQLQSASPTATYDLPCGGEPLGALVRTNASRDTLYVAMVVRVNKILCTALPNRVTTELDYVSAKGYEKVEPMAVGDPVRISPLAVSGLRVSESGKHIEAVFENGCGKLAGTILRRGNADTIEIGIAEMAGAGATASAAGKKCQAGAITATVPGAAVDEGRRFRPYEVTPSDVERAFFVRLAEVKPGSLVRRGAGSGPNKSGSISMSFFRKCNEAPVGVVVDGETVQGRLPRSIDVSRVRVGILVARYYNLVCPEGTPLMVEDRITNHDINIPERTEVTFMAQTHKPSSLSLREPSQYAMLKKQTGRGLVIDYKTSCNRQLGAVYTRDGKGHLAVGILERQGDPFRCKAGRDVTLVQPFAGKGAGVASVYPLKIRRGNDRSI